jgi:acyl-CoA thioesterase-1
MRARDLLIAFLVPLILLFTLYYYGRGPQAYRPEKAVKLMHAGQNLTIVFFGDSITSGFGESNNYVYQFRIRLKGTTAFDRTKIFNEGIPGNTAADGLARVEQSVISHRPNLIYIAFGGNDMKNNIPISQFEGNLREIVRKIQASTTADIILMTTPVFDIPFSKGRVKPFNKSIRKIAKETGVGCIDIYKRYKKEIGWFGSSSEFMQSDHIHPNQKGHQLIFQEIWRTLE